MFAYGSCEVVHTSLARDMSLRLVLDQDRQGHQSASYVRICADSRDYVLARLDCALYGSFLYKRPNQMPAERAVSVSFKVTPEFKELLEVVTACEQRSRTNLLEKLLFDHCRRLVVLSTGPVTKKTTNQGNR
jgi:hypothetical protein